MHCPLQHVGRLGLRVAKHNLQVFSFGYPFREIRKSLGGVDIGKREGIHLGFKTLQKWLLRF